MTNYNNSLIQNDLHRIYEENLNWLEFEGKSVLITGATGLIASYISYFFLFLKRKKNINIHLFILCRNQQKAEMLFGDSIDTGDILPIFQDVCEPINSSGFDYIFHLAGNASPYYILNDPVGIIKANVQGTLNVLELARKSNAKVFFASTREVYGEVKGISRLNETSFGCIDCMKPRSCYPESKRIAESLLVSYYHQYGIPIYIARIAHTYGPGMNTINDGRIMSDLIGNAQRGEDIVLKSNGEAKRAFCYVSDTVAGCLYVVLNGAEGEAYNLSNEKEEISIRDLAGLIASQVNTEVKYEISESNNAYCNYLRVGLDTTKLEELGWIPKVLLEEGIIRTIKYGY